MSNKMKILSLYKSLLRESEKFSAYNYRMYAIRRIRDAFRERKNLSDPTKLAEEMTNAQKTLALIRRQVTVQNLYGTEKLVVEK